MAVRTAVTVVVGSPTPVLGDQRATPAFIASKMITAWHFALNTVASVRIRKHSVVPGFALAAVPVAVEVRRNPVPQVVSLCYRWAH